MARKNINKKAFNVELETRKVLKYKKPDALQKLNDFKKLLTNKAKYQKKQGNDIALFQDSICQVKTEIERKKEFAKINTISDEQKNRCSLLRKEKRKIYDRLKYLEKKEKGSSSLSFSEIQEFYAKQYDFEEIQEKIARCKPKFFRLENRVAQIDREIEDIKAKKGKKVLSDDDKQQLSNEQKRLARKRSLIKKEIEAGGFDENEISFSKENEKINQDCYNLTENDIYAMYRIWDFRDAVLKTVLASSRYKVVETPFGCINTSAIDELDVALSYTESEMEYGKVTGTRNLDYQVEVWFKLSENKIIIFWDESNVDDIDRSHKNSPLNIVTRELSTFPKKTKEAELFLMKLEYTIKLLKSL